MIHLGEQDFRQLAKEIFNYASGGLDKPLAK